MAALSLRRRESVDATQFIEELGGSHRYIMDYLVDEVLQGQPTEVQTFLLYTSILNRLCGPLCDAILHVGDTLGKGQDLIPPLSAPNASTAQEILDYLEHTNLFVTPLDNQRHWYRYHRLFADLLHQRLQNMYPNLVSPLHLAASQWYEETGLVGPAVQHALAAHSYDRAATLVEQVAPAMIEHIEITRLLAWIEAIPNQEIQHRPRLGLYYVWLLFFSGQIQQAETRLEDIESLLATDETKHTPEVQSYIAAMRARLLRDTGDFAAATVLSHQALVHLPKQDTLFRDMVTLSLATAHYLRGEFDPAAQLLTETITAGQTAQLALNTFSATYIKSQLLRAQGALRQALQLCHEGLALVARRGWQDLPAIGFLYVALGNLLWERNELIAAAEYLEKGIKLGQEGGHPAILVGGNVPLAWLRQSQGDESGSIEAIRAALQFVQQYKVSRFWPIPSATCAQTKLWIVQGNIAAASRWAQENSLNEMDSPVTYLYEADYLTLVRLLIAQGKLDDAEALLLQLHQAAIAGERNGSLIEILILQAITFASQKRNEEALSSLDQALGLAEGEGFVRIFLDEGPPMAGLLRQAVAQNVHTSYALHLLNALGETAAAPQPLIEPLSERELEVLQHVAAGYSNQEIAQELVLAESTVKKHIHNIYGKLGVGSRTQAIAQARELGLL